MNDSLLSPWMAWALSERGRAQLIDVRPRGEVDLPQVTGARVLTLDELPSELTTLDHDRPVVFLSRDGSTATEAMALLRAVGMTANAVQGGIYAWIEAGLPVEAPRRASGRGLAPGTASP